MSNKYTSLKICGSLVYIKEPTFEELDYVETLWSDIDTTKDLGGPFQLRDREAFYKKMVFPGNNLNKYFLIYTMDDVPVGEISFRKPEIYSKTACFNIKVEFTHRSKGYGHEAMDLILNYYFNEYGGEIMEDDISLLNITGQKALLKYGFSHIPTYKDVFLVKLTKEKFNYMKNQKFYFKDEDVVKYLCKWQKILRLSDFDIKYEFVLTPWRKTGDIKIDISDKKAILMLNNCDPKQTNLEALIIHELLHLKLWGMDQMLEGLLYEVFGQDENDPKFNFAYGQFMTLLESTVEDLAKGYMNVGGDEIETSFGRVQKEVEKEIKRGLI